MDINNIVKCKFLKSDETITGSNIKEIYFIYTLIKKIKKKYKYETCKII